MRKRTLTLGAALLIGGLLWGAPTAALAAGDVVQITPGADQLTVPDPGKATELDFGITNLTDEPVDLLVKLNSVEESLLFGGDHPLGMELLDAAGSSLVRVDNARELINNPTPLAALGARDTTTFTVVLTLPYAAGNEYQALDSELALAVVTVQADAADRGLATTGVSPLAGGIAAAVLVLTGVALARARALRGEHS